jgi:hypothetical protein
VETRLQPETFVGMQPVDPAVNEARHASIVVRATRCQKGAAESRPSSSCRARSVSCRSWSLRADVAELVERRSEKPGKAKGSGARWRGKSHF